MRKYILLSKKYFYINLLGNVVIAFLFVIFAKVIQTIIDAGMEKNIWLLKKCILISLIFVISISITRYVTKLANSKYLTSCMEKLQNDYIKSLLNFDLSKFNKENTAKYISIFENDIKMLENKYFDIFPRIIANLLLISLSFFGIALYSLNLSIFTFIIYFPLVIVPIISGKYISEENHNYSLEQQTLLLKLKDVFNGYEVIKGFKSEETMEHMIKNNIKRTQHANYKIKYLSSLIVTSTNVFGYFAQLSFYLYGAYLVYTNSITVGALMGCIQLSNQFVSPVLSVIDDLTTLKSVELINKRINTVMNMFQSQKVYKDDIKNIENITINDLSFSYENTLILNHISFTFNKGKKYVIVGNSGSGKTTLIKLLQGFYNQYTGSIRINNIPLPKISEHQLLDYISSVNQNVFLFEDTIYNNLTMFTKPSDEKLNQVLTKTGITQMLKEMPDELNSMIIENGKNLSGGQKQRLSLARTLLRNPQVLIVDEATSNLDLTSSVEIEKLLLSLENTLVINVTHKLIPDILVDYDEIIVLKKGTLVEFGSYSELIEKKGYFYKMLSLTEE